MLAGARATAVIRARYAEDRLAAEYARGVRQYVILGAGLDSFAHRAGWAADVRVFEVDRPAMSTYKQDLVAAGSHPKTTLFLLAIDEAAELLEKSGWRVDEDLAEDDAIDTQLRNQATGCRASS